MAEVHYFRHPQEGAEESDVLYKAQRAENERLKAEERDLKLAKARGELIERDRCLRQASYVMTAVRQRLLLVPTLAARKFKGIDRHEARRVIAAEVHAALEELADFPEKVVGQWRRTRK